MRPSAHARGYTREWAEYSRQRLALYPLCQGLRVEVDGPVVVNTHPGRQELAVLTDHIVPHKGDPKRFWDRRNHQSGCSGCHDVKTAEFDGGFGREGLRNDSK